MKMNSKFAAAVSAFALLAGPSAASAATVTITYAGTVSSGYDGTGVFGSAGGDLTGDSYTATYVFNTSLGNTALSTPTELILNGGAGAFGIPTPLVNASLTINGVTVSVPGGDQDLIWVLGGSGGSGYDVLARQYGVPNNGNTTVANELANDLSTGPSVIPFSFAGPVSYTVNAADSVFGDFVIGASAGNGYFGDAYGDLSPASLTVSSGAVAAAAPEPSTWAMMLVGFAGLGFAGYRRRKTAALVA